MENAQGSLEYLLLIGGAVVVGVIVVTLILSLADIGEGSVRGTISASPLGKTEWSVACANISGGYTITMSVEEPEKFDVSMLATEEWFADTIFPCPAEQDNLATAQKTDKQIIVSGFPTGSPHNDICDEYVVSASGDSITLQFDMQGAGWELVYANSSGETEVPIVGNPLTVSASEATRSPDIAGRIEGGLDKAKLCVVLANGAP